MDVIDEVAFDLSQFISSTDAVASSGKESTTLLLLLQQLKMAINLNVCFLPYLFLFL